MSAKAKWLDARRALLRHVKVEVQKRLGATPDDLAAFALRYEKELRQSWTASSTQELLEQIENSNLVYGGDFHALAQAQRSHLRLLRDLKPGREVILALECFQATSQRWLDLFNQGELSISELRSKSKWDQRWGFPWDHYRPIFELARQRGMRLVGVNSRPSASLSEKLSAGLSAKDLKLRETKAAATIAHVWARHPNALVYVLFGDLHLASAHLPAALEMELRRKPAFKPPFKVKELKIHLNSEHVYFELAKRGAELSVDVVKFNDKSFCILSTPPWVKWQSYLLFLDRFPGADVDQRLDDESGFDPTDQVALLVRLAASDLGLKKEFATVNDLAVYGEDDETIWREVSRRTSDGERAHAQSLLRECQAFFLPRGGLAYLPKPTINASAAIAGFYLHARLSGRQRSLWKFPGDFRALVWTEAISYFISKLVNHSRRSETLTSLQFKLKLKLKQKPKDRSQNIEALKLALDFSLSEILRIQTGRRRTLQIRPRRKSSYAEASRILGGMLGERLYLSYRSRKLKRALLVSWLKKDPTSKGFETFYDMVLKKVARPSSIKGPHPNAKMVLQHARKS